MTSGISPTSPCGHRMKRPDYRHVVWIIMENEGFSSIDNRNAAPYLSSLARACGLATNYHAVSHPSLPNYIALASGSTQHIADDNEPSAHPLSVPNIFSELRGDWRAIEESMPTNCDRVTSGTYAARHDPAVYFTNLGMSCLRNDTVMAGHLQLSAAFIFITPNVCHDMHSCSITTGDTWLHRVVASILRSPQYRSGHTALFITWDEADNSTTNRVATFVIAPTTPRGERAGNRFSHYSLLRTTEQLLHVRLLGSARSANSMIRPFHL